MHKAIFPASECQAMLTYKEKYSIYRVFNAGQSEKVMIEKIKNPLEKIIQGKLGVESMGDWRYKELVLGWMCPSGKDACF